MKIGIVKESKDGESRVACTVAGVAELIFQGHQVYMETKAGVMSGCGDEDYLVAGAKIVSNEAEVFKQADFIYKVKELSEEEWSLLESRHVIFTFLHTNSNEGETAALLESGCTSVAIEDISDDRGEFPVLKPMSELAGKIGFIQSVLLSQSGVGASGLLLNGITGLPQPEVVIFGAGNAGRAAAELAHAFKNKVTVLGRGLKNVAKTERLLEGDCRCAFTTDEVIKEVCPTADVIINCVLWPKNRDGHLLTKADLKMLKKDCLIIDVACDDGGAIESCHPTSLSEPFYKVAGRTHYCVDNLPALYGKTATNILCETTLPYVLEIGNKGIELSLHENNGLRRGLTTYQGKLTLEETAEKQGREYTPALEALAN